MNLHQRAINSNYSIPKNDTEEKWLNDTMVSVIQHKNKNHPMFVSLAIEMYEKGISCIDLIQWIQSTHHISDLDKCTATMCFDKIKSEYRCEKLLILYIFDFLFLRSNKDLKCVITM